MKASGIKKVFVLPTYFGSKKRTVATLLVTIPVLVYAASMGYQYYLVQNPAVVYAHKLQTMTDQVSKSIRLPSDETPTVATVSDKNILPKEAFFQAAQNGDKILMYKKHKLAILYRPGTGQVITRAALVFKDITPTPSSPSANSETSSVAGASTSASAISTTPAGYPSLSKNTYKPQGKILVVPQQR